MWGKVEGVVGDMVESARVDVIPLQTGNLACDRSCKASWEFVLGARHTTGMLPRKHDDNQGIGGDRLSKVSERN